MSMFNILKRNRKYFAATKDGYKCKILIDSNSENLELGEQTLAVDDISVRSKYGTDLIFKLSASAENQKDAGICTLKTPYNIRVVDECRRLGGKWDGEEKAWIFPGFVADKVEALDEKYNSELINIEITFPDGTSKWQGCIDVAGFKIASATGRDSGAKIANGVAFIKGEARSGGSVKNWMTVISEGTVIRMSIPELCFVDIGDDIVVAKI